MGIVPQVKCRRCGATFSSLRDRCPNCGTRRVSQSSRTPPTTPGTIKGTAQYEKANANTKWQILFGMILLVAVILAVIVLVSTELDGADAGVVRVTPTMYIPPEDVMPTVDPGPTPTPTPEPSVNSIRIRSYNRDVTDTDSTLKIVTDLEYKMKLTAYLDPPDLINPVVKWSVSDDSLFVLTPDESDPNVVWGSVTGNGTGIVTITAECYGVTASTQVRCIDG